MHHMQQQQNVLSHITDSSTLQSYVHMVNERKEYMQETQHAQQTATRRTQNQDIETT